MKKVVFVSGILAVGSYAHSQNIAVNTSGAAAVSTNMFEVMQSSGTTNTVGIFAKHNGAAANAYAIWAEATGAGNKYAIVVPSGGGSVGIGTVAPASLLHLQSPNTLDVPCGDLVLSRYWASTADTRASSIFHYYNSSTSNDDLAFGVAGSGGAVGQPNALSQIKMLIQANGYVGIGNTAPQSMLHIGDAIAGGYRAWMQYGTQVSLSSDNVFFGLKDEGAPRYDAVIAWGDNPSEDVLRFIFTATGGPLNGAEIMRLQDNGNVGIGTTAPGTTLEVKGTGTTLFRLQPSAASDDNVFIFGAASSSINRAKIYSTGNLGDVNGDLRFATGLAGTAVDPAMVIRSSGNVGIGTTTPTYDLDITKAPANGFVLLNVKNTNAGTNAGAGYITYNDANNWAEMTLGSSTATTTTFGLTNANFANFLTSTTMAIGNSSANPIIFGTNNVERMRLLNTGSLKITGTSITSPGIWMEGTITDAAGGIDGILSRGTLTPTANNIWMAPFVTNLGTVNTGTFTGLTFYGAFLEGSSWAKSGTGTITNGYGLYVTAPTIATSNYAAVFSGGNVGVGVTSPATKLDVSGGNGTTLKIVDTNQGAGKVLTSDAAGVASWAPLGSLTALNNNQTVYTASNTWVVPAGIYKVSIELWGGGGGGTGSMGEAAACCISGAGGGSGEYVRDIVSVTPGNTYYITVGGGGGGGAGAPAGTCDEGSGTSGGNSCFSTGVGCTGSVLARAFGGGGGTASVACLLPVGGAGGTGGTGFQITGGPGAPPVNDGVSSNPGGNGGSSTAGAGAIGVINAVGTNGTPPGGGGSGGGSRQGNTAGYTGGSGAIGRVVIIY